MATKTLPPQADRGEPRQPPVVAARRDWRDLLQPLASLRLTVVLFAMSIFIILVGTLAQAEKDMWEVMDLYFRSIFAWIELKVFFPPAWFPQGAPLPAWLAGTGFWFPGGFLIGGGLFVNLLAAHLVRFSAQARGMRLAWGLGVTALGIVLTVLVILSGHNREGLQGEPLLPWNVLWAVLKMSLAALWIAAGATLVLAKGRGVERIGLGVFTVGLGALLFYLLYQGDRVQLSASSLRILWQLIQGGLASFVLLAGCILIFKKRGGIVLLHAGVGLMMFYELFVSMYAVEARMTIREGETVGFARDIRAVELAVIDRSPAEHDQVTVIPGSLLQRGQPLEDPRLPFRVELVQYLRNSDLRAVSAEDGAKNPATAGVGQRFVAEELRAGSGADSSSEVDMASAYVKLTDPESNQELGTYLLSVILAEQEMTEKVEVGGKSYDVALRFKRDYKPYSLSLTDVRRDNYPGTTTPRNYSSDLMLVDESKDVHRPVKIWMNNPLRYAGETFYQSGYQVGRDGVETTDLQVVTNTGWMIPYVACMIVTVGLLAQFVGTLLRFLSRREQAKPAAVGVRDSSQRTATLVAAGAAGLMILVCLGMVAPRTRIPRVDDAKELDLYRFGQLPVRYQGRVKPLDTLARNSLQIVSNRREYYVDEEGQRQPAIRWLLDLMSDSDAAEKHKVFRIDSLEVLDVLGLERRSGFRYAVEEFRPKAEEFNEQVERARKKPREELTSFERKLLELDGRIRTFTLLQASFRPLPFPAIPSEEEFEQNREAATQQLMEIRRLLDAMPEAERILSSMQPPQAVPVLDADDDQQAWAPYGLAMNRAFVQRAILQKEANPPTVAFAGILHAYRDGTPQEFNQAVSEYQKQLRDELPMGFAPNQVRFESFFNHFSPFYQSMILYLVAFVLGTLSWLGAPLLMWRRPLNWAAFGVLMVALVVHTFALIARIYISGRPPVTNLYSSAVFIGWACVVLAAVLELVFRVGFGNVVAAVSGYSTLLIAYYLTGDGDTVAVLQAVLDTQFWLATHVLAVTAGYSTTFLAGLFGILFIARGLVFPWLQRLLGMRPQLDASVTKALGVIIYGVVCFSLFFSFFGTVLGGLWADDSWGRFWGWDPKENGALMIVLWNALILHARWGGIVKERGMAVLAVAGNIVTSWSWFGVNELGIGLHSYGFTEGVLLTLGVFWISQLAVIALGMVPRQAWWLASDSAKAAA
ncbi:MAG: cytochrome c biogenesis protein CcsA [Pirellulaceae bacterium]|nr:cytochrome c biogenesis protein CcsA [Pirellulaceae bacterium]